MGAHGWVCSLVYAVYQMLSLGPGTVDSPLSSRPQPLGSRREAAPCEDPREELWAVHLTSVHHVSLQGGFEVSSVCAGVGKVPGTADALEPR